METTTFNYYFDQDREGHEDVVQLFQAIGEGQYEGFASDYVMEEIQKAQEPKRSSMLGLIERYGLRVLEITPEVQRLASLYVQAKIVPASQRYDSVHIAAASVYGLACIVSYNFKHINRSKVQILTATLNDNEGYYGTLICTAREVLNYARQSL